MVAEAHDVLRGIVQDAESAHALRSCKNCFHRQGSDYDSNGIMFWKCNRLGGYCDEAIKYGQCTVALKYWAPKPQKRPGLWARMFGSTSAKEVKP